MSGDDTAVGLFRSDRVYACAGNVEDHFLWLFSEHFSPLLCTVILYKNRIRFAMAHQLLFVYLLNVRVVD